jgi:hypothetical protein
MTEHDDAPAGSGSPEGGVRPSSASEILRRLREKNASGEATPPRVDLDLTTLGPPDLSPPDLTRPPLASSIMSAEQRRAENDRLAEAARASRNPTEPSTPEVAGRAGFRRVFGGLFGGAGNAGGGGGGNNEPPDGRSPFDADPDEPSENNRPRLRERTLNPDDEPWKESPRMAMRFIIEEVDVVPRQRNYENISKAYDALKEFYKKELLWSPESQAEFRVNVIKERIAAESSVLEGKLEFLKPQYDAILKQNEEALKEITEASELFNKGIEGAAERLAQGRQSLEQSNQAHNQLMSQLAPQLAEMRGNQLRFGTKLLHPDTLTQIDAQLAIEGLTTPGPEQQKRYQELLGEAVQERTGIPVVSDSPLEALTGVSRIRRRELWSDLYGSLHLQADTMANIQTALNNFWDYIESPIQIPDPQRVIGDLQQIRRQVAKAQSERIMTQELNGGAAKKYEKEINKDPDFLEKLVDRQAQAIADNPDFWLAATLNERFARVGDKGNRAALMKYVGKERGRSRIESVFTTKGVGGYDPAMLYLGLHLLGERGYSTLMNKPEGPRFEMVKETDMHDWVRGLTQAEYVEELAHYDINTAGDPDLGIPDPEDDIEQEINQEMRRKMTGWAMKRDKTKTMYVKRKKEEFSPEEWQERMKKAKTVARLARLFNAFEGMQAEAHVARIRTKNGQIVNEKGEVIKAGDAVRRRDAEYFVKYAIIDQMRKRGISPIQLNRQLLSVKSSERTPLLVELDWAKPVVTAALNNIYENGNNAQFKNADGEIENIEDIIEKDEIRLFWDGYIANDDKVRAAYLSDEVAQKVRDNLAIPAKKRPNFGTEDFYALVRKVIDPNLELPRFGVDPREHRPAGEALDFVGRLQAEVGMVVMDRFFNEMYLGSQGLGPFADSHVYSMRDGINRIENVKYLEKLICRLPEIYATPIAFGCLKIEELPQILFLQDPQKKGLRPESEEDWSFELRGDEYEAATKVRELALNSWDDKGNMVKGLFYEPLAARTMIEHTLAQAHSLQTALGTNQGGIKSLLGVGTERKISGEYSDEVVSGIIKNHLSNLQRLTALTINIMTNYRNMRIVGSGNWYAGIQYDYWMDRMGSHHGDHDTSRDKVPGNAYGSRIGHPIQAVFGETLVESSNEGIFIPVREAIKETLITSAARV